MSILGKEKESHASRILEILTPTCKVALDKRVRHHWLPWPTVGRSYTNLIDIPYFADAQPVYHDIPAEGKWIDMVDGLGQHQYDWWSGKNTYFTITPSFGHSRN